jgi:hypothetical protein
MAIFTIILSSMTPSESSTKSKLAAEKLCGVLDREWIVLLLVWSGLAKKLTLDDAK